MKLTIQKLFTSHPFFACYPIRAILYQSPSILLAEIKGMRSGFIKSFWENTCWTYLQQWVHRRTSLHHNSFVLYYKQERLVDFYPAIHRANSWCGPPLMLNSRNRFDEFVTGILVEIFNDSKSNQWTSRNESIHNRVKESQSFILSA